MISCLIYVLSLIVPPSDTSTSVDGNQNDDGIILGLSSTAIAIIAGIAIIIILLLIVICCIITACCCLRYIALWMYVTTSLCQHALICLTYFCCCLAKGGPGCTHAHSTFIYTLPSNT